METRNEKHGTTFPSLLSPGDSFADETNNMSSELRTRAHRGTASSQDLPGSPRTSQSRPLPQHSKAKRGSALTLKADKLSLSHMAIKRRRRSRLVLLLLILLLLSPISFRLALCCSWKGWSSGAPSQKTRPPFSRASLGRRQSLCPPVQPASTAYEQYWIAMPGSKERKVPKGKRCQRQKQCPKGAWPRGNKPPFLLTAFWPPSTWGSAFKLALSFNYSIIFINFCTCHADSLCASSTRTHTKSHTHTTTRHPHTHTRTSMAALATLAKMLIEI